MSFPAIFAARLHRRLRRGAALFEAVLALVLLGVLAVSAALFMDSRSQARLKEEAGRQVAILGHAAAHYARTHYADDDSSSVWPASGELSYADLQSRGILPASFAAEDAMKRGLRVWYQRVGSHQTPDRIRVLAGQHNLGGDERVPLGALFGGTGRVRTGIVRTGAICRSPLTSPCLVGPAVAESLSWASPAPEEHAVMAFYEITRDEYCGDLVLRDDTPVCLDSGRIEGDLDMGGADLRRTGTLTVGTSGAEDRAHELTVREDMTEIDLFELNMPGEGSGLAVDRNAKVDGHFKVSGALSVYGDVRVEDLKIRDDFDILGDLDVTRRIDGMETIDVTGNMEVKGSEEALNVRNLNVGSCPKCTK